MKKQLLKGLSAFIFVLSAHSIFAQDTWTPSVTGGFGDVSNKIIRCLHVFKGNIYAGTGEDSAAIYSSSTGNYNSWHLRYSGGYGIYGIESFASTPEGGGYMYAGTNGSGNPVSQVLRTADGSSWDVMYNAAYGVTHIIPFKGLGTVDSIYVVENNYYGDLIMRAPYDANDPDNLSGSWVQSLDMSGSYASINCWQIFNGRLYLGKTDGAIISTADGMNWQPDTALATAFFDGNNYEISAMGVYGGYLYVGTYNYVDGTQIWRTNDDTAWTQVSQFANYQRITSFTTNGTELWIALNNGDGGQGAVYKSNDGLVFSVSENNGFGTPGDDGQYAQLQAFGNNMYCSTQNYNYAIKGLTVHHGSSVRGGGSSNGAEIWRTCLGTPPVVNLGADTTICQDQTITLNAGPAVTFSWNTGDSTQTIMASGSPAGTMYSCYITDASGCTGSDMIVVTSKPVPTLYAITPFPQNTTVCLHDSISLLNQGSSNYRVPQTPLHYTPANDSIHDNLSSFDTVTVSGVADLASAAIMSVTIDSLYHTYDGDIEINLHAPDGSVTSLSNQNGSSGDNYIGTVFSALSSNNITLASPPFTGIFAPQGGFNSFSGPANGSWVLEVTDHAGGDEGIVKGWSMQFSIADTVLTFSWTPSTGLSSASVMSPEVIPPAGTTIYTLTATNAGGCAAQISDTINVPVIHITTADDSLCAGGSTILSANGGVNPVWAPAATLSSTSGMNVSAMPAVNTTYYVTDTVSGCAVTDSMTIFIDAPFTAIASASATICSGDTAAISVSANGGTLPYSYHWSNGDTAVVSNVSPTATTSYFVFTSDSFGCTQSSSTTVTVRPSTDIYGHVSYSGGGVAGSNVVIYRYEPFLVHFDTVFTTVTDASGNYHFNAVAHNNYLIEVFPAASYTTLVPSYYGDVFLWDSATVVTHDCVMPDTFNIVAVEATSFGTGPGYLHGRIVKGEGFGAGMDVYHGGHERAPGEPIPGIDVKLGHNPGGQMVTTTVTDGNGDYHFSGVAYGNYTVYVDIPGLGRDSSYTFTVDSVNSIFNYLDYTVDSTMIRIVPNAGVGVNNLAMAADRLSVYPNPSKGDATVQYTLDKDATISLGVYNVLGVKVKTIAEAHQQAGTYKYSLDRDDGLRSGVYFVTLIANGKTSIQRIIITE